MEYDRFFAFRYLSWIAVVASAFGAVLMFFWGVVKTIRAYIAFVDRFSTPLDEYSPAVNESIALIVQSIDAFMIGIVFIIFSYGVMTLFIRKIGVPENSALARMQITSIGQLKSLLGEMIIIVLFVKFLEVILLNVNELDLNILVIPVGIVLLALALKFLDLKGDRKE